MKLPMFDVRFIFGGTSLSGRNHSSMPSFRRRFPLMKKILNPRNRCADPQSPIANRKLPIRHSSSGMALVITLCLIVLVTMAAVAFFTRATGNRTVEASRVNQTLAAQVAESGADYAVGRLLLEIATNSTAITNNGIVIYYATNPASALPRRLLSAGVSTTDTNYVNLVRQSVPNNSADPNASSDNTATTSRNGRLVGAARWNAPMLLGGGGFTTTTQLPNWIYLNKDGSVASAVTTSTASNVIGRFSYNLYDQGGLLDVNVSGYPSSVSGTNLSILKGDLAGADLSVIPGISSAANMNTFVQWRNTNSATTAISYVSNVIAAATNGFLTPRPGDRNLLSRQDLIALARSGSYGITTNALPYLTTFTRTLNSPSWSPTNASGTSVDYAANRDSSASANRFLPNVRVATTFTRADGTTAQVGEPLLKTCFPLSRLAGIGRTGVNATGGTTLVSGAPSLATAATIQRDFGLVWSAGRWLYAGPSGSAALTTIATLGSVSGREPNFFELLKASILSGSLGREFGNGLSSASPNQATLDLNKDRQIIQLGLNIIDQYDGDSYPTQCSFNGANLYGIENLPYLNRVYMHFYRPPSPGPTNNVNAYWIGEVWNPHRGAPPTPSTAGPSNFRFSVNGGSLPSSSAGGTAIDHNGAVVDVTGGYTNTSNIQFTNPGVSNPLILLPPSATSTFGANNSATFTGIYAGTLSNIPSPPPSDMTIKSPTGLDFILEYQDGAAWVAYQTWNKITPTNTLVDTNGNRSPGDNTSPGCFIQGADPRTTRFGLFGGNLTGRNATWTIPSLPPTDLTIGLPPTPTGWTAPLSLKFGELSKNTNSSTTRYNDPDSILRSGDAVNSTILSTYPLDSTGTNSRPVILNRPFRSVAELGYAFRDLPYKSIDFFTTNSPDAGLLDTFCLTESPISGVTAGVINPNSANQPVLKAVLVGVLKDELTPISTLSVASEADPIATTMTNFTAAAPLLNRSELATRVAPALAAMSFTSADAEIKARRESVVRALADVSNTRTWNVMIDVIAQAGRFPPNSTGVAGDFIVEGERRSWLHAAIDRFTGRVVARSMESINE
jgi:Tfp pilus assembly protein PilX